MKQKQLKTLIIVLLLSIGASPTFADFNSSATFNGKKADTTPSGAGMIYVYHAKAGNLASDGGNDKKITAGSNPDLLPTSASIQWTAVENGSGGSEIDLGSDVGEYGGEGFIYSSSSSGKTALYVYFFAKPNPGYRFLGWSNEKTGATSFISGKKDVYTLKSKEAQTQGNPTKLADWNNGANPAEVTWDAQGYYSDEKYYYLRWVEEVNSGAKNTINYYAYFEMIPQVFRFGGTKNGATYTATSGSAFNYVVGTDDRADASSETAESITLTLNTDSYDRSLYKFAGWYYDYTDQGEVRHTQNLLSTSTTATYKLSSTETKDATWNKNVATWSNVKIYPLFVDLRFANFCVGLTGCQTLEQAIAAVADSDDKTILVIKNYTVPEGNYTIPEGVTLLIPYAVDQEIPNPTISRELTADAPSGIFRTLTLAKDAHLEVQGTIEVGGNQSAGTEGGGGEEGVSVPTGSLGCLYMKGGSSITLNNGAILRAWGYVLGDKDEDGKYLCEIDARRGSKVFEQFQIMDWKGGTYTYGMFDGNNSNIDDPNSHGVLPINQYYIQNVEVPVKYRPGAKLAGAGSVSMYGIILSMDEAGIIGARYTDAQDDAIFLMNDEDDSEDTWVRKYYDATTDQQIYEANNSAYLGSLVVNFSGIEANSREYKLPITNNFKIHLLNGQMEVTQNTEFLAGSELEINKKSTLTIPQGVNVYLYDKEDWGRYITVARTSEGACVFGSGTTVKWRPDGRPTVRRDVAPNDTVKISDTKLTISGTIDIKGKLFTTTHGATVVSTVEDAGTVIFSSDAPADFTVSQVTATPADGTHDSNYKRIPSTSVQLQNEDGSLVKTYIDADHHAVSGQSYCFIDMDGDGDGEWMSLNVDVDDDCFVYDQNGVYYIKPADYVAVNATKDANGIFSGEEDNTYKSLDGTRTFIRIIGNTCQWWEVVKVDENLYRCIHPQNDTYYYWDGSAWIEKKFKISWVNWDGSPVKYKPIEGDSLNYYMVSYGTTPEWLSANPTRPADEGYYTYDFIGWSPAPTAVTADAVYTATYNRKPVYYAITFEDVNHTLIELTYYQRDSLPVCSRHTLGDNEKWTPAVAPVTGDQVYTLATKSVQSDYTIVWKNWNGMTLETDEHVTGTPSYDGATPTKPALGEIAYQFNGWYPDVVAATEDAVYVAQFRETANNMEVNNGSSETVNVNTVRDTAIIHAGGTVTVADGKNLTLSHLILESTGTASGQLYAASAAQLTAATAYFDYKINAKNHKWYGVAVPWQVNATNGISVNGKTLELGKDFDIIYYDGARRAVEGKQKCWRYVEDDGDKTLVPGRLYMIGLMSDAATIRFAKKAGASLLTTTTSVTLHSSDVATDANWNGVANPALFHAYVNAGAEDATYGLNFGQVYNPDTKSYEAINMSSGKFVVGQGAFVQASANKSITVTSGGAYAAPRRVRAEEAPLYEVRIAPAEAAYTDRLFVTIDEDKEEEGYVIGQDLAKLGVSKQVAQMWINRYNTELCLNTVAPVDGVAEYPLTIFAPKAGEYEISSQYSVFSDQYSVYLTLNGEAIWNLSDGAYTLNLSKGNTTGYGLRISKHNAPQTTTGVEEAVVDAKGETKKVLINNQVFIIRGNEVYTIDGQLVK